MKIIRKQRLTFFVLPSYRKALMNLELPFLSSVLLEDVQLEAILRLGRQHHCFKIFFNSTDSLFLIRRVLLQFYSSNIETKD